MSLSIQLVGPEDTTFEYAEEERVGYYLDSYMFQSPTETIDQAQVRRPYKRSNVCGPELPFRVEGGIVLEMCPRTYKLGLVRGSEEGLIGVRRQAKEEPDQQACDQPDLRLQAWENWVEKRRAEMEVEVEEE
ncbi:hypothetical protein CROQUDRAFT_654422 [Cronartium quercuum f. sp. fusiforme G11]|uniref:Sin3 C-terminal domain-containing protein n=1 Tax=Cronartium quercuum f. sp. fusiforme G11 TaxID=708437 RepID=A0A9P6NNK3_9BASI|nr:hypothetical protein CROQUDRAFT_654422 [Cronartium quercuum f. sp. fusiforme G11]